MSTTSWVISLDPTLPESNFILHSSLQTFTYSINQLSDSLSKLANGGCGHDRTKQLLLPPSILGARPLGNLTVTQAECAADDLMAIARGPGDGSVEKAKEQVASQAGSGEERNMGSMSPILSRCSPLASREEEAACDGSTELHTEKRKPIGLDQDLNGFEVGELCVEAGMVSGTSFDLSLILNFIFTFQ